MENILKKGLELNNEILVVNTSGIKIDEIEIGICEELTITTDEGNKLYLFFAHSPRAGVAIHIEVNGVYYNIYDGETLSDSFEIELVDFGVVENIIETDSIENILKMITFKEKEIEENEVKKTIEDIKDMVRFMQGYSVKSTGAVDYNNPAETTTGSGLKYTSSVDTYAPKQTATPTQNKKPAEVKPQRQHTIVAGDTLWDLAQKFYGNPFKWTTIAQANKNPDPYKLQIGRKLIIPFKSGGYTGSWAGDEGKIAMLHKKELVLNAEQTEHILSSAKLMDSVMRMIPKFKANQSTPQLAGNGGQNITIENMEFKFDKFKGTREDANNMVDTFITRLKKM